MARRGNSVFGIDLGKHVFKGVLLQRKGDNRFVLTSYASREVPEELKTPEELAQHLKLLFKDLGGSAKGCAIAISDPASLLRIIEQPDTPIDLLRNALRLNGLAVLNQECKDFVLDCAPVLAEETNGHATNGANGNGAADDGPNGHNGVAKINAFEFAYPQIFANDAFLLLDMGHLQSTVLIGSKKELVLVRSIDYGGKALTQALTADGALDANAARVMIAEGDAGMAEICRSSLTRLATEVRNSIGFYEGQHEQSIHRIFVSGGLAKTETILQTLSDELGLPCEIWDPLETCEVALPPAKRQALPNEFVSLNVACGAAFEYLRN